MATLIMFLKLYVVSFVTFLAVDLILKIIKNELVYLFHFLLEDDLVV